MRVITCTSLLVVVLTTTLAAAEAKGKLGTVDVVVSAVKRVTHVSAPFAGSRDAEAGHEFVVLSVTFRAGAEPGKLQGIKLEDATGKRHDRVFGETVELGVGSTLVQELAFAVPKGTRIKALIMDDDRLAVESLAKRK